VLVLILLLVLDLFLPSSSSYTYSQYYIPPILRINSATGFNAAL
jgi:hypothetical protein